MKILSADQIRLWDQYTIDHEPIASIDLMERAAAKCTEWLLQHYKAATSFAVFCGKGNNGGDGLAIARMLLQQQYEVTIYILEFGHKGTNDFQINLARLHQLPEADIHFVQSADHFHVIPKDAIIIDALFGTGLNRNLETITEQLVRHINQSGCEIVSIDIPSGLFTDRSSKENTIIQATHTLSFQCYKQAFLVAENEGYFGQIHLLDIGLNPDFLDTVISTFELLDADIITAIYQPRTAFAHKGNFGHALLIAGSYGKMGAAVLAAKACLRSGVGLLTCHIPAAGYEILQTVVPEAMVQTDADKKYNTKIEDDLSKYKAIGIGPGIGTAAATKNFIKEILTSYKNPVVLDADALNNIAAEQSLLQLIPKDSILTPHPKEFERLFGTVANEFDRIDLAIKKAVELNVVIVLKGHHTLIASSGGKGFFNTTGNAGMATGGSGDVLTGIITGLIAQGYPSLEAALLGVYLHGLAGDIAAKELSMEAIIAGDIIDCIGKSFQQIQ